MIMGAITPVFYALFVDEVLSNSRGDLFIYVVIGYLVTCVVSAIINLIFSQIKNKFDNQFRLCLSREMLTNITNFGKESQLDFMDFKARYMEDVNDLVDYVQKQKCEKHYRFILALFYLLLLLYIQPLFAIISLVFTPISFLITAWRSKKFSDIYTENYKRRNKMERFSYKSFESWKEIKIFSLEDRQLDLYNHQLQEYGLFRQKLNMYNYFNAFIEGFQSMFLLNINIYLIGYFFIINGSITVGILLMFAQYYNAFYSSILAIQNISVSYQKSHPALERINYLLFEIKKIPTTQVTIDEPFQNLELKNVSFTHVDSFFALKNVDLSIRVGDRVAIIGETGSGKSTLLQILLGMLTPQSGRVFINKKEISGTRIVDFNRIFSVISQEIIFFNISIKENFLLVKPNATDEVIEQCCRSANIWDKILELPDRLNAVVGENANLFSKGERQRLAFARALLNDAGVYVFDEITSALDPESDEIMCRCIEEIPEHKSIVMVTHKIDRIPENFSIFQIVEGKLKQERKVIV